MSPIEFLGAPPSSSCRIFLCWLTIDESLDSSGCCWICNVSIWLSNPGFRSETQRLVTLSRLRTNRRPVDNKFVAFGHSMVRARHVTLTALMIRMYVQCKREWQSTTISSDMDFIMKRKKEDTLLVEFLASPCDVVGVAWTRQR